MATLALHATNWLKQFKNIKSLLEFKFLFWVFICPHSCLTIFKRGPLLASPTIPVSTFAIHGDYRITSAHCARWVLRVPVRDDAVAVDAFDEQGLADPPATGFQF